MNRPYNPDEGPFEDETILEGSEEHRRRRLPPSVADSETIRMNNVDLPAPPPVAPGQRYQVRREHALRPQSSIYRPKRSVNKFNIVLVGILILLLLILGSAVLEHDEPVSSVAPISTVPARVGRTAVGSRPHNEPAPPTRAAAKATAAPTTTLIPPTPFLAPSPTSEAPITNSITAEQVTEAAAPASGQPNSSGETQPKRVRKSLEDISFMSDGIYRNPGVLQIKIVGELANATGLKARLVRNWNETRVSGLNGETTFAFSQGGHLGVPHVGPPQQGSSYKLHIFGEAKSLTGEVYTFNVFFNGVILDYDTRSLVLKVVNR